MTTATRKQPIPGIALPAFVELGTCEVCEQPAAVAQIIAQDGEPETLCEPCWKSGKDFVRWTTCSVCGKESVCLHTDAGWCCPDCLDSSIPAELLGTCARCGHEHVLRQVGARWLCMRCQIAEPSNPSDPSDLPAARPPQAGPSDAGA